MGTHNALISFYWSIFSQHLQGRSKLRMMIMMMMTNKNERQLWKVLHPSPNTPKTEMVRYGVKTPKGVWTCGGRYPTFMSQNGSKKHIAELITGLKHKAVDGWRCLKVMPIVFTIFTMSINASSFIKLIPICVYICFVNGPRASSQLWNALHAWYQR